MARFTTKELLKATTLIALGMAAFTTWPRPATALLSFPLLGAGLLTPFRRAGMGAVVGASMLVLIPAVLLVYSLVLWLITGKPLLD